MPRSHVIDTIYFDTIDGSLDGNGTFLKDVLLENPRLPLALFIALVLLVLFLFFAVCHLEDEHEVKNAEVHDGYEQEIEMECLDV